MKKIILVFTILLGSLGYSQVVLEDFEGDVPLTVDSDGMVSSTQSNPDMAGANPSASALQLISDAAGQPWQGARLVLQNNKIDMTTANKVMTADVYSNDPREFLAKLSDGDVGGLDANQESKTAAVHTGNGWETLTFDFNIPADTSQPGYNPPDDQFSSVLFFPLYDISNDGWCDGCGQNNALTSTTYVDNIAAVAGDAIVPPVSDPEPAPLPNSPDNETYSIYNDTNGYTTNFPFMYSFGTIANEPDLDLGSGPNLALKFDFSFAGYGQGEGGPDDVSAYNFVHFMYWAEPGVPGFQFRLISNDGGVLEFTYEIGTDEPIVTGQWTLVTIPMSYFTNLGFPTTSFYQWKLEAFMQVVTDPGIVFIDNILLTFNTLSVDEFDANTFNVYPNPTTSNWNVKAKQVIKTIEVFDVLGKSVLTKEVNSANFIIETASLNAGLYFAKLDLDSGTNTIKLIKK